MYRQSYNRAVLHLQIETVTPLLIKAGDAGLDPTVPDLACVRTHHGRHGKTVYIPGASLKGVMRAAVESALRGLPLRGLPEICDPLGEQSCGARQGAKLRDDKAKPDTAAIHAGHCLACRLFGSTVLRGRAALRDLFPWRSSAALSPDEEDNRRRANHTEGRHGVAINRLTGGVQHGPFDMEMVPAGVFFAGDIAMENYQAFQLGLLALALDEINEGFAQLGSAKSRGFGVARATVERIVHEQTLTGPADRPVGVGALADEQTRRSYGLLDEIALPTAAGKPHGLSRRFELHGEAAGAWLRAGLGGLQRMVEER